MSTPPRARRGAPGPPNTSSPFWRSVPRGSRNIWKPRSCRPQPVMASGEARQSTWPGTAASSPSRRSPWPTRTPRDASSRCPPFRVTRLLEGQLRQSQKMDAIGQLAGGVAHDFNNMLTAIMGYAELLLAEPALTEDQREDVSQIRAAGERAASLTQQLLAFSRHQVRQPRVVRISEVVTNLLPMLRRILGAP